MKHPHHDALVLATFTLAAVGACYHGKDDVPHTTGDATTSASSAGGGSSASVSASASSSSAGSGQSTSGAGGGGGSVDPCANTIFCDDFEGHPTGAPPGGMWKSNPASGTVAVDTGRAHSGKNAVKLSADAVAGYRSVMISLSDPSLLPVAGGVLFGRMMFYLESAPTGTVHWTFLDGSGPVPGQSYHAIYRYGGQLPIMQNGAFVGSQLMANYETPDSYQNPPVGPGSDCWLHSNMKVVPVGAWSCAEWEFDQPNNTMHFWLDGAEVPDLTMTGTGQGCVHQGAGFAWTAPSCERVDLGWESYQADDARVLWIDDVALGIKQLGCPK